MADETTRSFYHEPFKDLHHFLDDSLFTVIQQTGPFLNCSADILVKCDYKTSNEYLIARSSSTENEAMKPSSNNEIHFQSIPKRIKTDLKELMKTRELLTNVRTRNIKSTVIISDKRNAKYVYSSCPTSNTLPVAFGGFTPVITDEMMENDRKKLDGFIRTRPSESTSLRQKNDKNEKRINNKYKNEDDRVFVNTKMLKNVEIDESGLETFTLRKKAGDSNIVSEFDKSKFITGKIPNKTIDSTSIICRSDPVLYINSNSVHFLSKINRIQDPTFKLTSNSPILYLPVKFKLNLFNTDRIHSRKQIARHWNDRYWKKVFETYHKLQDSNVDCYWLGWLIDLIVESFILQPNDSYVDIASEIVKILSMKNNEKPLDMFLHKKKLAPYATRQKITADLTKNAPLICECIGEIKNLFNWLIVDNCELEEIDSVTSGSTMTVERKFKKEVRDIPVINTSVIRKTEEKSKSQPYNTSSALMGSSVVLPENAKTITRQGYRKVSIPPPENHKYARKEDLVNISELDPLLRKIFNNVEYLNVVQTKVFRAAYFSNGNLLVSAPTGAGKTNVALLTIVGCLKKYFNDSCELIDRKFKIIYVSPMKALASEMTQNFGKRLKPIGIRVRELTGDTQLSRKEIDQTEMLITTPEKWDVISRKPSHDELTAVVDLVRLLIIDEVHLLNNDRGAVVEAIVARTLRQVESSQSMIRLVGLSATLPNYLDVARFLRVDEKVGLFHFGAEFRPVPLEQTFIGVDVPKNNYSAMNNACYEEVISALRNGYQVMVFVHSRISTSKTGKMLRDYAQKNNCLSLFEPEKSANLGKARNLVDSRCKNPDLRELFSTGIAIHHAGMIRTDRNLVEKYFLAGYVRVLICTATLAWGVNLPAHTVVIMGTEINVKDQITDLDILDVQQIFGRAGRPQFDKSGHGIIITASNKLDKYIRMSLHQTPIESNFHKNLTDHLNAEIVLGTVTNIHECIIWLSYTFLNVRSSVNPLVYGLTCEDVYNDPALHKFKSNVIMKALKELEEAKMVRLTADGQLISTAYGQIASHYYIKFKTMEMFTTELENEERIKRMTDLQIFKLLARSEEFTQIKLREEEVPDLQNILEECPYEVPVFTPEDKVCILMQAYIGRVIGQVFVKQSSLITDLYYIEENASRLSRALFEVFHGCNMAYMAGRMLSVCLMFSRQQWDFEPVLNQFKERLVCDLTRIQAMDIYQLIEGGERELGRLISNNHEAPRVMELLKMFPKFHCRATMRPITRTVLQVIVDVQLDFTYHKRYHGNGISFWLWVEDPIHERIYHSERVFVGVKEIFRRNNWTTLYLTISLKEPIPAQYIIKIKSDEWLGAECHETINFSQLKLSENLTVFTPLQQLIPLPITVLQNKKYESLYKFDYFNPIQTQMFFTLYQTDINILLGAPTGSGKTIIAEIAVMHLFNKYPTKKAVYIAPLKALVRERYSDWLDRFHHRLGKKVVELTGDTTPGGKDLELASLIISTPEKWDVVSRTWEVRNYVKQVGLVIIDEIHLLGEDRGPALEAIVSRLNYIASKFNQKIRVMGLSTAIANSYDVADWLGIPERGVFNFRSSVRPVPLDIHVTSASGKAYCMRMKKMNKPTYQAIKEHASDTHPTLVFVSSRRQTRLTAEDLIKFCMCEGNYRQWLRCTQEEIDAIVKTVQNESLQETLAMGVGQHHAGLIDADRKIVERLFLQQKIQVLVATSTLAWGVNFPARLVVVKGTEYYDAKTRRYIDMPMTDILQMVGRAGRPQFDNRGVAVVITQDVKREFYKRFLYEPFPIESHMLEQFPNHLNAEIASGMINDRISAHEYATWTFLYRRLKHNPDYYGVMDTSREGIQNYTRSLIDSSLQCLREHNCIEIDTQRGDYITSTVGGKIASNMYLSYQTIKMMTEQIHRLMTTEQLLEFICSVHEYAEVPVRHNEDGFNTFLSKFCPIPVKTSMDSPHTKTFILLQSHMNRYDFRDYQDYTTDLKSIFEQLGRICQGIMEYAHSQNYMEVITRTLHILQMISQAQWINSSAFNQIGCLDESDIIRVLSFLQCEANITINSFPKFVAFVLDFPKEFSKMLKRTLHLDDGYVFDTINTIRSFPIVSVDLRLTDIDKNGEIALVYNEDKNRYECDVLLGFSCLLEVDLKKYGAEKKNGGKAFAPFYPKIKMENWVVCLYDSQTQTILFKKALILHGRSGLKIRIDSPALGGVVDLDLFVLSDSYVGLDQTIKIQMNVLYDR